MSRYFGVVAGVLALALAASASAGELVPVVDRGIVVPAGSGEVGLDLSIGLDKGAVGKRFQFANAFAGDRYSGISFAYGVIPNLEVGLATSLGYGASGVAPRLPLFPAIGDGFKWGGAYIYGKYGFLPFLGVELGIRVPGEHFGDYRTGLNVGIPFKFAVVPGLLAIHVRPDLLLDFADKNTLGGGKAVQIGIVADYGVTINATKALYFDVSSAVQKRLSPSASLVVPLAVTAGYTVLPQLDVYLNFAFNNLAQSGAAIDSRDIGLGAAFRF